jgi:hypothetical protein
MQGSHEAAMISEVLVKLIGPLQSAVEEDFSKAEGSLAIFLHAGNQEQRASLSVRVSTQGLGRGDHGICVRTCRWASTALWKWRENGTITKVVHGAYRWIYATQSATESTAPDEMAFWTACSPSKELPSWEFLLLALPRAS